MFVDPNNSIAINSEAVPKISNAPITPSPSDPVKKESNTLTIVSVAVFIILALGAVAYLYYQNQQLKGMLASYQNPTPTSSATALATADPTANWKTYTNSLYKFSFTYPAELTYLYDQLSGGNLLLQNFDGSKPRKELNSDFQLVLVVSKDDGNTLSQLAKNAASKNTTNVKIGEADAVRGTSIQKYVDVPTVWFKDNGNLFTIQLSNPNSTNNKWFDQILSTFKFTEAMGTASPTAAPKASISPTPAY